MRKFRLLAGLLGWLLGLSTQAQQIVGTITDVGTGQGLPFVNIGVVGKGLGTVTSEQGSFHLLFNEVLATDTVRISSLGYQPRQLTLRALRAQPNQALTAAAVSLTEVRVQAPGLLRHLRTLGFTKDGGASTVNFNSSKDYGAEIGTRIQLRHRPTLVQSATFNVAHNQAGSLTFRVNLYRLAPDGRPTDAKLLPRDVLVTTNLSQGPVMVDLSGYRLVLDEDFLLALEWVQGSNPAELRESLAFTGGVGYTDNDVYVRSTSQGAWEPISMGAILVGMQFKVAFYVTVQD